MPDEHPGNPQDEKFTVKIFGDKNQFVLYTFNATLMELNFYRANSIGNGGAINKRTVKIPKPENNSLSFRFFADVFSCEIFINGGQIAFTNAFFLNKNIRKIKIDTTLSSGIYFKLIKLNNLYCKIFFYLICPSPSIKNFVVVRTFIPIGPRA